MSIDKPNSRSDDKAMPVWMGELCQRFKDAWGSDNPINIESIVERVPADKRSIAIQTLVEAEYVLRSATNNGLTAKELAQRFPNDVGLFTGIHRRLARQSSLSNRETRAPKKIPFDNAVESGSKALQIPRQLGRYRIVRKLGQGAMGAVFLAKDEQLDRQVALKFPLENLRQGDEQQGRFLQEARAAAALHHANICPIYDAGEIQGINYICMGYVEGSPLSRFAVPDSGLTEQQIARIVLQIAKAVAAAHVAGFIHRDLKPSNIMIDLNNEPVILDFGLARRFKRSDDQRATQAGAIMGSPCYMSPEQVDGDEPRIGPLSDLYSLGVILYEMLTGRVPFEGSFASIMGQIMTRTPDKPSVYRKNLSVRMESICNKMMAKQQNQRFPSMQSVADALQEYLDKFDGPNPAAPDNNANETTSTNMGEQRKKHIEQLIRASDYGPAETLLVSLSRETSDTLQQYAVWAAAELPKLRKLREQVRAGRQDIYETATRLMKTFDYAQVVRLLSDYPYDIRTPNMQKLLERAERLSNEVQRLSKGIAAARTRGDNDTLMKMLPEKLKLKPHDREAKELYDQLICRSEGPISKLLGGNTPRTVRSIPAGLQWLLIFAMVVPFCAVPAYIWSQKYLARKSETNQLPIAFNPQEILGADDANASKPPKPDEIQPPLPPMKEMQLGLDAAIADKDLMEANRIDAATKEVQRKMDAGDSADSLAQSSILKSGEVWNGLAIPMKGPNFKEEVSEIKIKISEGNETGFQGTYEWISNSNAGRQNQGSHQMSGQQLNGKISWIGDNSSHGTLENSVMLLDSKHGEYFAEFWLIPETDVMGRDEVAGTYTVTEHGKGAFELALKADGTARKSHAPRVLGRWLGANSHDRILVCWTDGWRDVLTKERDGWKKESYPPAVSLAGESVNAEFLTKAK